MEGSGVRGEGGLGQGRWGMWGGALGGGGVGAATLGVCVGDDAGVGCGGMWRGRALEAGGGVDGGVGSGLYV